MERPYRILGGEDGYEIVIDGVLADAVYPKDRNSIVICGVRKVADCALKFVGDRDTPSRVGTLSIGADVEEIEPGAFENIESVDSVIVDEKNPNYKAVDDVLFTKDGKTLLYCPANKRGSYTVPEGTETIASDAFYYSSLKSIILPESIREINDFAFMESDFEEIRGISGSYAEAYADEEDLVFVAVDEDEEDDDGDDHPRAKRPVNVILTKCGPHRVAVIKILKEQCGMDVAEAKAATESVPTFIKKGMDLSAAKDLALQLRLQGADTKIR